MHIRECGDDWLFQGHPHKSHHHSAGFCGKKNSVFFSRPEEHILLSRKFAYLICSNMCAERFNPRLNSQVSVKWKKALDLLNQGLGWVHHKSNRVQPPTVANPPCGQRIVFVARYYKGAEFLGERALRSSSVEGQARPLQAVLKHQAHCATFGRRGTCLEGKSNHGWGCSSGKPSDWCG